MKSDKATVMQRVEAILQLRIQGASLADIRQYASQQAPPWNVSERPLQRYILASGQLLRQRQDQGRSRMLGLHLARRDWLYAAALSVNDYATAARILKDQAELLALYPAKRTELSGP